MDWIYHPRWANFPKDSVHVGNVFTIEHKGMIIRTLISKIEVIQKILAPKSIKECKHFHYIADYLSLFCRELT